MYMRALVGLSLLIVEFLRPHSELPHSVGPGRVLDMSQRPLPDNTQHSQQTDIHAPGGIRTPYPSKGGASDPYLDRAATGIGLYVI